MLRKLLVGIGAATLVASLVPSNAGAQVPANRMTVAFTAGAKICVPDTNTPDPNDCKAGEGLFAPVAPHNPACGLSTCPAPAANYSFSTNNPGLEGHKVCIGNGNGANAAHINSTVNAGNCVLGSEGVVLPGAGGLGGYCFYSKGHGTSTGAVGTVNVTAQNLRIAWPQSAGSLLALVVYQNNNADLDYNPGVDTVVGAGQVQTLGAAGPCGLSGSDSGATTFSVTGFVTAAA